MQLEHGGDLYAASARFNIPKHQWLDLSTGINRNAYPIPDIPADCFQQLPDANDALLSTAQAYYRTPHLLAAPGLQRLIQVLPLLRTTCRIAVPDIGYCEHKACWYKAGHKLVEYEAASPDTLSRLIRHQHVDAAIAINPNNVHAGLYTADTLLTWADLLARQDGWLIVDETFIDAYPQYSLMLHAPKPGLIVLRSLGKFFGLAGIRVSFVAAPNALLQVIDDELGIWSINGPGRWMAVQALSDQRWQQNARERLLISSLRMQQTIYELFNGRVATSQITSTPFFVSVLCSAKIARNGFMQFARQGILIRLIETPQQLACLRFRVIDYQEQDSWQRFQTAIAEYQKLGSV